MQYPHAALDYRWKVITLSSTLSFPSPEICQTQFRTPELGALVGVDALSLLYVSLVFFLKLVFNIKTYWVPLSYI